MNYRKRSDDLNLLHPRMLTAAVGVLNELQEIGIIFRIFESYRSPERQNHLFKKKPRRTRARAWQSYHQYGVACDFVIDVEGVNPWSTKTDEHKQWWVLLHEAGQRHGLHPLSFEKPHMQLSGLSWRTMKKGIWPEGGDDAWADTIHEAMARFPRGAPRIGPDYEDDVLECRPVSDDGLMS